MLELLALSFSSGILITAVLALAGAGLFMHGSVWQALAVSQWAAAGGVLASVFALPVLPVAIGIAGAVMAMISRSRDAERLPLVAFLAGLALVTLLAANFAQASLAAASWAEGQLYFVGAIEFRAIAVAALASLMLWPILMRLWLHHQLFPDVPAHSGPARWRQALGAAWLLGAIVLGSMALGVPAALATLLLPAWGASFLARDARGLLGWSLGLALAGFLLAWGASLALDQPFAPVLVLVHLMLALLAWALAMHTPGMRSTEVPPSREGLR